MIPAGYGFGLLISIQMYLVTGQLLPQEELQNVTACDVITSNVNVSCGRDEIIAVHSLYFWYHPSCESTCCGYDSSHSSAAGDTVVTKDVRRRCSGNNFCSLQLGGVRRFPSVGTKNPSYVVIQYYCISMFLIDMEKRRADVFPRIGKDKKRSDRVGLAGILPMKKDFRGHRRLKGNNSVGHRHSRFEKMENGRDLYIYIHIVSTLVFIAEVITIVALKKCKKTPLPIRYFSVSFLASDAMFQITGSVISIGKLTSSVLKNVLVTKVSFQVIAGLTLSMSWASINVLALDRFIATSYPLRYKSIMTRSYVLFIIACIWGFNIFAGSASFVWFLIDCSGFQGICSDSVSIKVSLTSKHNTILTLLLVVYETLNIVAFICLRRVLQEHHENRTKIPSVLSVNKASIEKKAISMHRLILSLTILHLVLHLPYLADSFLLATNVLPKFEPWRGYLTIAGTCLLRVSSIGSIFLYLWRLPECKLVLIIMFCRGNSRYRGKIRTLYHDVYNIRLPEKVSIQTTHGLRKP